MSPRGAVNQGDPGGEGQQHVTDLLCAESGK
jgi:hypothetical protein